MWFIAKAAFWLGLVFLLLPDPAPGPAPDRSAALPGGEEVASAVIRGAARLCRDNVETCTRGAGFIAEVAQRELVGTAVAAPRDTLTPTDLAVPFGGVEVPAGSAPKRAPLPPRRPV